MDAFIKQKQMQIYKIWAPDTSIWSEWAKPVLFAGAKEEETLIDDVIVDIPQINWLPVTNYQAMIIVDLPGKQGVEEGLGLASRGYQPVPLYNGVAGPKTKSMTPNIGVINETRPVEPNVVENNETRQMTPNISENNENRPAAPSIDGNNETSSMTSNVGVSGNTIVPKINSTLVDVHEIVFSLFSKAFTLKTLSIKSSAPPAFLLDSRRMPAGRKTPGLYDNRWSVFAQDMPSASFLLSQKISEVIVRSDKIEDDLSHILCRYQEQGIAVSLCDGSEIKQITVSKPSLFKSLFYRFKVICGLTRNATGGFGGIVPEARSGGG